MRALLVFTAVALAAVTPTAASAEVDDGLSLVGKPSFHSDFGRDDGFRHDGRRHRRSDGAVFIYDRDYQGDTAWRSDSFNDWWHDNPQRAYPRWMLSNQGCDRKWYQGNVLTC